MARQPKPWRRESCGGAWYAQVRRVQTWLAPAEASKTQAWEALRARLAEDREPRSTRPKRLMVRDVVNLFLADVKSRVERGESKPITYEGYERNLAHAVIGMGTLAAEDAQPHHVESWLNADPPGWGPTTRFNIATAVKAAFNWAKRTGRLSSNPLEHLKRPRPRRREEILSSASVDVLLSLVPDREFRDLLTALMLTGCRPGEIYRLTAEQVDLDAGVWLPSNKTEHATGERVRRVHLTPAMVELTRRLVELAPDGPIFRNTRGKPWTRHTVAHRLERLAKHEKVRSLGLSGGLCAYAIRHAYATEGLVAGVPIATVAELMGHKDVTMVARVYSKLGQQTTHLREAASRIRPATGESAPPPAD